jgi:hypothetical protein
VGERRSPFVAAPDLERVKISITANCGWTCGCLYLDLGRDFLEPLQRLLTLLTPRTEQIRAIADEMRVQPSVDLIALDYGERVPALRLQPEHLQLLANLRSRLWLDVL